MELRHLRYFIAVAEELHFARAAERLRMEQSPLSRAIRALERDLQAPLFERTTRSTRLTVAGEVFLVEARRILAVIEQARSSVHAAAQGYRNQLRVGVTDGLAQPRLARLFAESRNQEPDLAVRVFELSFVQQLKGLRNHLLDLVLALSAECPTGLTSEPIWQDPIAIVLPAGHPLAERRRVSLEDVAREPLVLCHPEAGSGGHAQIVALIHQMTEQPTVVDHATSLNMMTTLVGAGFGIGFAIEAQAQTLRRGDVVVRPLAGPALMMTTYALRRQEAPLNGPLRRFLERAKTLV